MLRSEESQIPLNSAIGLDPTDVPEDFARALAPRARESLVVLTHDPALGAAVRAACGPERELFIVGAEADLAAHLISDCAGVIVIDTAATVSPIAQLTQDLKAQFPDLELIVAGGASEAAQNARVASAALYRFLHKPASEQRIRLFIDAAWRRRSGEASTDTTTTLAQLSKPAAPRRSFAPGMVVAAVLGALAAAGGVGWLMGQGGPRKISAPAPEDNAPPRSPAARAASADADLSQLLARASAAFARGDWLLPAGESATDLYRQALERHHDDPQALAGLDKVVDQVLSAAEQDLLAQHLDEAEHLTAAARAIAPNSVRVSFLATQIARERERTTRAQARQQLQQQQQADELERKQRLIADARAALTAGKLDDAARLISVAADAGVDRDAVDTLTRDMQGTRLVATTNDAPVKSSAAPAAATASEPKPDAPPASDPAAAVAAAATVSAPILAAAGGASSLPAPETRPPAPQQEPTAHANETVNAGTLERLRYVAPEYPARARANGTTGWVELAFDVQTDGAVTDITVVNARPKDTFERVAVAALRQWRYRPAVRDGHPVERRAQLRILFTLK
jgi:protein TonB